MRSSSWSPKILSTFAPAWYVVLIILAQMIAHATLQIMTFVGSLMAIENQ